MTRYTSGHNERVNRAERSMERRRDETQTHSEDVSALKYVPTRVYGGFGGYDLLVDTHTVGTVIGAKQCTESTR